MYLLVESGSTKADWVLFDQYSEFKFETPGLNPTSLPGAELLSHLHKAQTQIKHNPEKIYFYGAGTSSPTAQSFLRESLNSIFSTSDIFISSDLLAAARALCNQQVGIIILLGTGSHAALCDGFEIIHKLPSLGYLFSDEGSGNHLGKEILKAYLYKTLDKDLCTGFQQCHPEVDNADFIYKLYKSTNIPAQLATYGQFVIKNKNHENCKTIIDLCLEKFIKNKLYVYRDKSDAPVHSCGSIAYFLQDELRTHITRNGFKFGNTIQKPLLGLLEFHRNNIYR